MPFDAILSRGDLAAGTTEQVDRSWMDFMTEESAAIQRFRRVPVGTNQLRFPVLSALPFAYFVQGDTGIKQTTDAAWTNKFLDIQEIAAIMPIPDAVLDDAGFDVWGETRPLLREAVGMVLDGAVFFGVNKPSVWPTAVVPAAIAAGNDQARGASAANAGGLAQDLNLLMGEVEADGFDVNGFISRTSMRATLRGARATDGQKLLDISQGLIEGVPVTYGMRGLWPSGANPPELIAVAGQEFVLGVRQDVTFRIADQAVLQDNTGAIVLNAFQQDSTFLRIVFRVGWQVRNTINRERPVEASRYPAAVLTAP